MIAAIVAATMIGADLVTAGPGVGMTREDGAIETAGMLLYVYAALCWLILTPIALWSRY